MLIRKETKTRTVIDTIYIHKCDICNTEFSSDSENISWCSPLCFQVVRERRRKEAIKRATHKRKERIEEAKKQLPDSICSHCKTSFRPARVDSKYCSDACRQRAYRERKSIAK